ncbi:uncharacterized protein [Cicer arietinum]|uniref:Nucleolin-like n=1 Tax=Cicer arietinum TaxID=3827 RepID=A0A1S2YST8_CICAR|nr:nucleolin-like [Cicer arietinum]
MRTRNSDSSSKSTTSKKTPPPRKSATKSAVASPPPKRTPTSKTRNAKKIEVSPTTDPSSGFNPDQSQKQKPLARATTTKSAKRKTPGKPRTKVVAVTPNLEEQLEAEADETPVADSYEAAEQVEEPGNVKAVVAGNIESEKEGEQSFGCDGLFDGTEQKPMEVDEPVAGKVCKLVEKGKNMADAEPVVSPDASLSFKRSGHIIVDLNISMADNEDYTGAKEGGEESKEEDLNIQEGERGMEELKEQEGGKGKNMLKEQEGEKGKEELNQQKSEKEMEEFKVQEREKEKEELKEQEEFKIHDGETGNKELKEQEGEKEKEELKEQKGEKGKEVLEEPEGKKEKEELKAHEGEKEKEELKEEELEKAHEVLKEPEGKKEKEELKAHEGEKEKEELKEEELEKAHEVLKEPEGKKEKEELKAHEGEKEKEELKEEELEKAHEVLKEPEGKKEKEELKAHEGEKEKEELNEEELEKAKGEETNIVEHEEHSNVEVKAQLQKDVNLNHYGVDGPKRDELLDFGEQGRVELDEEDPEENPEEDPEEPPEETETLDEEHMELEAIAKQRKINKEHEIFVGGLDHDATEEDLRKVFQRIGDVVEVRLHKRSSTNKNKGYAFVKFASKEHAKKALSEMKNPVIHGKRCGTAPSEDNDTLFLGNICNTWTKDAIKQKLKDYGVEGVENITLVPDVQRQGMSRGFAFIDFSCHADAMLAYKRLQKPDVILGHAERTAKVAFAEPTREPDPEIMAKVKSVFINGLPLHWDEDHVRKLLKSYGEIIKIVLARNMSTAKRKDYGFVDFSTHEAAVACIDGVNKSELKDGASKVKVRARLSNPLPKTPAVKGGMCGGFRIGHARSGTIPRSGRGFGRGRQPFSNRGHFNRDRGFHHHGGRSQIGRMSLHGDPDFSMHPDFHHTQRQFGPQGAMPMRGGHYAGSRGGAAFAGPSRQYHDRAWYGIPDGGPGEPIPPRRPYSPGGQFDMPFMGRHIDDPYLYDDNMHGIKRPFYMTDPEPDYMGPNRLRPRFDYADPSLFHGSQYHDYAGAGSRQYLPDYYGSDHGGGPYSSFYRGDGPHGHRYY